MACLIIFMFLCAITMTVNGGSSQSRQSHFGFMGTRGKRSINDDHGNNLNDENVISNLSQTSLLETKNQQNDEHIDRYISDYLRNNLPELSNFKRSPQSLFLSQSYESELDPSFSMDMRGRRISPLTAFNRIIMNPNPKRAPYGFMGMRGKKQEILIDNKRVPVGFLGTRGKKYLNDYEEYNYDDNVMENYQNSEIQNLYRPNINQQDQRKLDTWNLMNENKRAPTSSGFFGMRGKKFYNPETDINAGYINNQIDDFEKRAPTGFLGMRGKKFYFNSDGGNALNLEQASLATVDGTAKRRMNGFFGVRGKKDVSSQLLNEDKRSFAQYFGIRGKKQPFNSGFFGMRGKKQPLQFRGKFVGVRGKKSLEESSVVSNELKTEDTNNIDGMLSVNDNEFIMKRNPSGFIGMRGKKIPDTDEIPNKN